jgi:2-succinyl-5-enolpyruvyl-6-hydroxy-3-cyclohexene-1-carboxylate synthase
LPILIRSHKKILLSIGKDPWRCPQRIIIKIASHTGFAAYADISSGLRLGNIGTNIIKHFDHALLPEDLLKRSSPDILLHFGGRMISKRFGLFFKEYRPKEHIVIDSAQLRYDPIFSITQKVDADISDVCSELIKRLPKNTSGDFKDFYLKNALKAQDIIEKNIESDPHLSEPFLSRAISMMIPKENALFLSNSMPVRDMELYAVDNGNDPEIGVNRGASGIDGIISSAIGFALSSKKITTLLIGDMAFIHDLNALSILKKTSIPLIIVLVNNNGGGIFHFLPIHRHTDIFEDYFAAPHGFDFALVTKNFKLDYFKASNKADFIKYYTICLNNQRPAVIEASTDRDHNLGLRRNIKMEIIAHLKQS